MITNSSILIIAGSETTATLLSGATFYLLTNPSSYKKLVSEIRTTFSSNEDITITSTARLQYLQACLEESLRLYPPVATGLPRRTEKTEHIDGHDIPPNVRTSLTSKNRPLTKPDICLRAPALRWPLAAEFSQPKTICTRALA